MVERSRIAPILDVLYSITINKVSMYKVIHYIEVEFCIIIENVSMIRLLKKRGCKVITKKLKEFDLLFDIDFKNWGCGIWLHLDGQNCYDWAFEIIFGCLWFEVLKFQK
jgi:hypothetical protein